MLTGVSADSTQTASYFTPAYCALSGESVKCLANPLSIDPMKANQDSLSVTKQFAGESGDMLFVVYDGHGAVGHHCAEFAENNLPKIMAKTVRQKRVKSFQDDLKASGKSIKGSFKPDLWPQLSTAHYEAACKKSFDECNTKMHQAEDVRRNMNTSHLVLLLFITLLDRCLTNSAERQPSPLLFTLAG